MFSDCVSFPSIAASGMVLTLGLVESRGPAALSAIAAGVALHLGIDYSLRVGVFGLAIFLYAQVMRRRDDPQMAAIRKPWRAKPL